MVKSTGGKNNPSALEQAGVESRAFRKASMSLEEIRNVSFVRVHSLLEQPFQASAPFDLPAGTGTCSGEDPAVLCLRPAEWLLVSETIPAKALLESLESLIDSEQTAALDASDGLAAFRLSGPGAPWLLGKLSCLDFLAGRHHGPHCARTKMGHAAVVVHYHQARAGQYVFDLVFDRSIAKYLWLLLLESADHAEELTINYGDAA
jgi:heterotetrameric sarcosine oxidase gamma subunit